MGSPFGGTHLVEATTSLKMVLGPKEEVVDPTIRECGDASSSLQHTDAVVVEQTTLTKTQRRRQLKKKVKQLQKSAEPATKEKEGGTKGFGSEVSTLSPKMTGLLKK